MDRQKVTKILAAILQRMTRFPKVTIDLIEATPVQTAIVVYFIAERGVSHHISITFNHDTNKTTCVHTRSGRIIASATGGSGDAAQSEIFKDYQTDPSGDLTHVGGIQFLVGILSAGVLATADDASTHEALRDELREALAPHIG